ncbi:hypothetical protein EII34_02810 [Arachnia propionica]|uniref:ScoMcrA-like SRA domain-containing protein n=1 Tax=Arachnia propionica TaxID=1750 RepID=A0A3P1TAY8_9ACTN|nr:hypothetical protein [Arachnia propionica]MDO5082022.1 hypothetical protein [Arachnia propionica]RRD06574.1 hypothetical protein EII34_02810 [Arachnia propionica]
MATWTLKPGEITRRGEIAQRYGGGQQRGIEPSRTTPNIMLYSDPDAGAEHDYDFDGWDAKDGVYHYTGEGQVGDQRITNGNRAIVDSAEDGRVLRVFETIGGKQPGGKLQRYIGSFRVDPEAPYRIERITRNGLTRRIVVFRLLPVDAEPPGGSVEAGGTGLRGETTLVGTDSAAVREFEAKARRSGFSTPERDGVMRAWEAKLRRDRHDIYRVQITLPAEGTRFLTDTYDATAQELFDVQPSSSRGHVRMGIGRLLDFRRHVQPRVCTLLLPERPSDDLMGLVSHARLGLVVRRGRQWQRLIHP